MYRVIKLFSKSVLVLSTALTLTACGGGGSGGGSSDPLTSITVSLSASTNETQVGFPVTLTWSSTNAQTCSATGDWSGTRAVSSSEEVTINKEGSNTFTLSCSANGATSGSASVQVTGVMNRINITDEIIPGTIITIPDLDVLELDIQKYYKGKQLTPSTGASDKTLENISQPDGIGYMSIGSTFKVA